MVSAEANWTKLAPVEHRVRVGGLGEASASGGTQKASVP